MKYSAFVTGSMLIIIIWVQCTSFKNTASQKMSLAYAADMLTDTLKKKQKTTLFDYPDNMVADTAKKRFVKEFNKGKILYNLNCAKCHNIMVDKKPVIPDFSLPQLMDYEIRIQYQAHEEDLKEINIAHDELDFIVLYLRYKKKSGMPYKYLPPAK
jgi:hypothetical protein